MLHIGDDMFLDERTVVFFLQLPPAREEFLARAYPGVQPHRTGGVARSLIVTRTSEGEKAYLSPLSGRALMAQLQKGSLIFCKE